jgi:glycosyltransferase involved in cell wall biosynthesis
MAADRPEIVFTLPAWMGGVASLTWNLVNHASLRGEFHSRVVLLRPLEDTRPVFLDRFATDETVTFEYSKRDNLWHVSRRLAGLLGSRPGAIVCDNMLTLQTAALFECPKTVYFYLHDFFYVTQNTLAGDWVDVAVTHSPFFADAAVAAAPELFAGRTFYLPYGVTQVSMDPVRSDGPLRIVFLGRLTRRKGAHLLRDIAVGLARLGIDSQWTIIGKGELRDEIRRQWADWDAVSFEEPDSTEGVYRLLAGQDLLVLPTTFEGTPVSILECLSNGVVPVVSDLPGGIRDIVQESIGRRVAVGSVPGFVEAIAGLAADRPALHRLQRNALELARGNYDIRRNADAYFRLFLEYARFRRPARGQHFRLGRLDRRWLPNGLVRAVRFWTGGKDF